MLIKRYIRENDRIFVLSTAIHSAQIAKQIEPLRAAKPRLFQAVKYPLGPRHRLTVSLGIISLENLEAIKDRLITRRCVCDVRQ